MEDKREIAGRPFGTTGMSLLLEAIQRQPADRNALRLRDRQLAEDIEAIIERVQRRRLWAGNSVIDLRLEFRRERRGILGEVIQEEGCSATRLQLGIERLPNNWNDDGRKSRG